MSNYEEKFIVINKKYLKKVPPSVRNNFLWALEDFLTYLPENKYIVCNQDEPYANEILKMILDSETKKESKS